MPTDIEIASNALILIGDEPISSFSDSGSGATAAANLYPSTYLAVLAEFPWSFARKNAQLSLLAQAPDPLTNFSFAYQLPADMIHLWEIAPVQNYEIVNDLLYSNINTGALAMYTFKVDETQLPGHFVKALEYKLASDFAISVTEDVQMNALFERKYQTQIRMARHKDSQQAPQKPIVRNAAIDVRFSGFSPGGF